jgi:hypothetical protein
MKMSNRFAIVVFGGLVIAAALAFEFWRGARRLETENRRLQLRLGEFAAAAKERPADAEQGRGPEYDAQQQELMRLRNEVAQLRAERESWRAEKKAAEGQSVASQGAVAVAPVEGQSIASGDWKFSGYGTPQSALVSVMWAMKEGQFGPLQESLTAEERARMEAQAAGKSEGEMRERFQKEYGQVSGLRVLAQHDAGEGNVVLDVYLEGVAKLKKYQLRQENGEWKIGGPVNQNFSPGALAPGEGMQGMSYYMSNPELMKRYFPQMYEQMLKKQQQGARAPE